MPIHRLQLMEELSHYNITRLEPIINYSCNDYCFSRLATNPPSISHKILSFLRFSQFHLMSPGCLFMVKTLEYMDN